MPDMARRQQVAPARGAMLVRRMPVGAVLVSPVLVSAVLVSAVVVCTGVVMQTTLPQRGSDHHGPT